MIHASYLDCSLHALPMSKSERLAGGPPSLYPAAGAGFFFFFLYPIRPSLFFFPSGAPGTLRVNSMMMMMMMMMNPASLGGQPLLIVGIAGPVVMLYQYLFNYCKQQDDLGIELFRPFCSWVLIWCAVMHFVLALVNASEYIHAFTRFAGETFGSLIGILFFQAAVSGLMLEFKDPENAPLPYRTINGIWSVFLAIVYVCLAVWLMQARRWHIGRVWFRAFVADYGATIAVVIVTLLSYAVKEPDYAKDENWEIPTRVACKQVYDPEVTASWKTVGKLWDVPAGQMGVALIPALIITVLFFFDHNVSSQLAQTDDFNLTKPAAYHYDFFLVGVITLIMGLLGMPPPNGAIPQSPMHTRALQGVGQNQAERSVRDLGKAAVVLENRVSNVIQSLLVAACMFISPVIRLMPRAVLWGYFIFMAIQAFPGNQFIHRVTLFVMDISSLRKGETQPAYVELVPMNDTMKFTALQLLALSIVYGVTWAGIYGISFPLFIMALVPLRQYVLVKLFPASSLRHLDMAEDVEEIIEEDGSHVDRTQDAYATGGTSSAFLGGVGSFVKPKHTVAHEVVADLKMRSQRGSLSLDEERRSLSLDRGSRRSSGGSLSRRSLEKSLTNNI